MPAWARPCACMKIRTPVWRRAAPAARSTMWRDARRVAYTLGMPHYVFNYKDAFREQVMARFAAAYQRGRRRTLSGLQPLPEIRPAGIARPRAGSTYWRPDIMPASSSFPTGAGRSKRRQTPKRTRAMCSRGSRRSSCAHALPARRSAQERGARHRRGARLLQRAQARQSGHLLCAGRRLCRRS